VQPTNQHLVRDGCFILYSIGVAIIHFQLVSQLGAVGIAHGAQEHNYFVFILVEIEREQGVCQCTFYENCAYRERARAYITFHNFFENNNLLLCWRVAEASRQIVPEEEAVIILGMQELRRDPQFLLRLLFCLVVVEGHLYRLEALSDVGLRDPIIKRVTMQDEKNQILVEINMLLSR